MQGSPLISLSVLSLVLMPGILSWRLSLLSHLVVTPYPPLVFSTSVPSGGVTSFCFLHCPPFSPLGWPQSGSARPVQNQTLELPECGLGQEPHYIDK